MKQDYSIAGHHIRVEGEKLVKALNLLSGFDVFETEDSGNPLCRFTESHLDIPPVFQKELYSCDVDHFIARFGLYADGAYLLEMSSPDDARLKLWVDKDRSTAYFSGDFDINLIRFACWTAFGLAILPLQSVAIHTSVIQYDGKAVLFLGESGTGKSTHTRLWRENIEGAILLNDDSPIVRIVDGKPWVYGSPWSGKTPCYKNEWYPLVACVRLSQAPYNEIKRLSTIRAYGALHPSCPPFFAYDDALYDEVSRFLSLVLSQVPVYHLACLPNAEAARLSFETIFGACEK